MKRIVCILTLISLLLSSLLLTSCHGRTTLPEFEMPESFNENKRYEITFWAKNDSNPVQVDIYNKAIADFEALYPNIDITIKRSTNYGDIYNDVLKNIKTMTTPNVCITYPDHIATYITGENIVAPLEELIADERYGLGGSELKFDGAGKDGISEKFLEEGVVSGVQYAIPFMRSTEACYVNVDMVRSLGYEIPEKLTWDWIFEVSRAAIALGKKTVTRTDKNGKPYEEEVYVANEKKVLIPFIYKSTDNMMIQMLKQKAAGYSTEDGEIQIFNDDTKQILYTVADATAAQAFSTFGVSGYPGNALNVGECIFAIDSTAGATWIGANAPLIDMKDTSALVDFEVGVYPIPQFDTENPQMISQGPSICIFNKHDSGEVLASWLFAQFLLTNEVQIGFSQTEGYIPVTKNAQTAPEYLDYLSRAGEDNDLYYDVKVKASKVLLDNIDNTFITPVFNGSTALRSTAGELIEDVVKSVRRKQTVDDEYISALYNKVRALYKLDQLGENGITSGAIEFGEMPIESVALIVSLIAVWAAIGTYFLIIKIKERKKT